MSNEHSQTEYHVCREGHGVPVRFMQSHVLQLCSPNHLFYILQRGVEEAFLLVERAHLLHLVVGQLEVEDLDVLLDVIFADKLVKGWCHL